MMISVYTDGSATTADKPGGWAYVLVGDDGVISEECGHVENATNNDMELEAAIKGLSAALIWINNHYMLYSLDVQLPYVELCSDSELILGWANGQYKFKQEDKIEKYVKLRYFMTQLNAETRWIKGHSGNIYNERCDKLANQARKGITELDNAILMKDTKIGTKKDGVVALWYGSVLKIVDLSNNIIENYNREIHGKRGSMIEIREEKSR